MKQVIKDLKGILLDGGRFFRVYDKNHPEGFMDYDIRHSDSPYIDHSPEVLGIDLASRLKIDDTDIE